MTAPFPRHVGRSRGFTLIDIMVALVVVGVLATIAIPFYARYQRTARIGRTAAELRMMSLGFMAHYTGTGAYPAETEGGLPASMATYIDPGIWDEDTPIGGRYEWESPDAFPYAGIAISPANAVSLAELQALDGLFDDGNLATGQFKLGATGRPTYLIPLR